MVARDRVRNALLGALVIFALGAGLALAPFASAGPGGAPDLQAQTPTPELAQRLAYSRNGVARDHFLDVSIAAQGSRTSRNGPTPRMISRTSIAAQGSRTSRNDDSTGRFISESIAAQGSRTSRNRLTSASIACAV